MPALTLTELQCQWLGQMQVDKLWGQPLSTYVLTTPREHVQTTQSLSTPVVHCHEASSTPQDSPTASLPADSPTSSPEQLLIRRHSPEAQRKSGRPATSNASAPFRELKAILQTTSHPPAIVAHDAPLPMANNLAQWQALQRNCYHQWGWCPPSENPMAPEYAQANDSGLWVLDEMPALDDYLTAHYLADDSALLLDAMLAPLGLQRHQVNMHHWVALHRNEKELPPEDYVKALPLLLQLLQLAQARCVWLWSGRLAQHLLGGQSPNALQGCTWSLTLPDGRTVPVLLSHHPRLLMRRPELKAGAWSVLQQLHGLLATPNA